MWCDYFETIILLNLACGAMLLKIISGLSNVKEGDIMTKSVSVTVYCSKCSDLYLQSGQKKLGLLFVSSSLAVPQLQLHHPGS